MYEKSIAFDFGSGFAYTTELPIAEHFLPTYVDGTAHSLPDFRQCKLTYYEGGTYEKALRLRKDIPTFDSSDREYDSYHDLYLLKSKYSGILGTYCTGGYEIAKLISLGEMTSIPDELAEYLK